MPTTDLSRKRSLSSRAHAPGLPSNQGDIRVSQAASYPGHDVLQTLSSVLPPAALLLPFPPQQGGRLASAHQAVQLPPRGRPCIPSSQTCVLPTLSLGLNIGSAQRGFLPPPYSGFITFPSLQRTLLCNSLFSCFLSVSPTVSSRAGNLCPVHRSPRKALALPGPSMLVE